MERTERVGLNEAVFREVNERLKALETRFSLTEPLDLVCECGDVACTERIVMSLDEYEALRSDSASFAIVPGHHSSDVEDLVSVSDGYAVVRKRPGEPAALAAATDPRM